MGAFTRVGWQVTLRGSEMSFHEELHTSSTCHWYFKFTFMLVSMFVSAV